MDKKNIAIVTGASSGLGKEFVKLLKDDERYDEIYVLARSEDKLNELKSVYGNKIMPYIIDLSIPDNIKAFSKYLAEQNVNVKLLINNAGFAKFCSYDDITLDESLNMINLNISGVVSMSLVCIPFMQKGSHIINIASQAAFQPVPYMNIYSATKSFVKNYSRALNIELKEKDISVTAVCPGWIDTELFDRGIIGAKKAPKYFYGKVLPKFIAQKSLNDAYKNKDLSIYGLNTTICILLSKVLPEKLIMKLWLLQQQIK